MGCQMMQFGSEMDGMIMAWVGELEPEAEE